MDQVDFQNVVPKISSVKKLPEALWVKSGRRSKSGQCPLYPRKRIFVGMSTMSAMLPFGSLPRLRSAIRPVRKSSNVIRGFRSDQSQPQSQPPKSDGSISAQLHQIAQRLERLTPDTYNA